MPARSKARKRALDVLFEAELRHQPVLDVLAERAADEIPPLPAYAADLVRGVHAHQERIDELLAEYAQGWALDRMPGGPESPAHRRLRAVVGGRHPGRGRD